MSGVVKSLRAAKKRIFKLLHKPWIAWLLISTLASGASLGARWMGWIEPMELFFYDQMVRWHSDPESTDDRIKIVGMTEDDLVRYGFPIDDSQLAKVLRSIAAQDPCVIGLDMYRDLKEPREGKYYSDLEAVLKTEKRIIAIERVGYVSGPPALAEEPDRIAANNFSKDTNLDGLFRRGLIALEDKDAEPYPSLSFALVLRYLDENGIPWELNPETKLLRLGNTIIPRLTPTAGGYVRLPVRDYEFLAGYKAPRKFRKNYARVAGGTEMPKDTSHDYSFGEVLRGEVPAGALRGKIVLVATVMESIKDSNPTPIDDNLRGVQQHAMCVHQLLEAAINGVAPMSWWPDWAEALFIVGSTLLGGALGLFLRSPLRLLPAIAGVMAGIFGLVWLSFTHGVWVPFGALSAAGLLASATVTSFVVLLERADRNAMRAILSKHVSKRVADYILSHREHILEGGMIPGRALDATIVFTDLAGFSTASERLTPEQTLLWLNDYMTVMVKLVEAHDGEVNKFIGDAIMALFGAPFASGEGEAGLAEDAAKAIRCALRMREEVPKLNAKWKATAPDMPPVAMRVGIFTGPIVDGSFGDNERTEYTVIGDAVNRANRLEAAGKEIKDQLTEPEKLCTILIGPKTHALVSERFVTEPVQNLALKGITERVTVYRVLAERSTAPARKPSMP
jgi:adenylate cyclase